MKALLQVRGVETLEIKFIDFKLLGPMQQEEHKWLATLFARRLSVLKGPYSRAETKRREARGITKETVLRNFFDGSETDTRAARYERRRQLKEIA